MLFGLNTIIFALVFVVGGLGITIYILYLLIKALKKYIHSSEIRNEKKEVKVERPGFLVCARISPKETINA